MKILVTGAHFTPAQAVIEELLKHPGIEIVYVGRKTTQEGDKTKSVESQVLPKLGVRFIPIIAGRVRRDFSIWTIISILKIPIGLLQAFWIILKEQPTVILSFGGYVSVPIVFWGFWFSIPIILHEQGLVSGLANTVSALFANKIAVSFKKDYGFSKRKVILTGNPVRREILDGKILPKGGSAKARPVIFITGGNQGSHVINNAVEAVFEELTSFATLYHQSGDSKFKDFERLTEKKNKNLSSKNNYFLEKWFNTSEIKKIYEKADLVICRAGINTLSEIAYFGIPALVIPLPHLYKNEQVVNAKFFEEIGLCNVLSQDKLTGDNLLSEVKDLLKSLTSSKKRAAKAGDVLILDAAKRLAQESLILGKIYEDL